MGAYPTSILDLATLRPSCSVDMVCILLEGRADPNDMSGYDIVWQIVLERALAAPRTSSMGKRWLEILTLFIQHNADFDREVARVRIIEVIDRFRELQPIEAAKLQEIVENRFSRRLWYKRLKFGYSRKSR